MTDDTSLRIAETPAFVWRLLERIIAGEIDALETSEDEKLLFGRNDPDGRFVPDPRGLDAFELLQFLAGLAKDAIAATMTAENAAAALAMLNTERQERIAALEADNARLREELESMR